MADEIRKDPYSPEELEKFRNWATEQEAANKKITIRAAKEFMSCGQIKAEALIRQYVDDKTRGVVETVMVANVPESVLNAMSEYMSEEVKKVVSMMAEQVKAAEGRAAESAERLEMIESTAEKAQAEADRLKSECAALKATLNVLTTEHDECKKRCDKLIDDLQASKIAAAAAEASLQTLKDALKAEKQAD